MTVRSTGDSISLMLKRFFVSLGSRRWLPAARFAVLALVVAALPACSFFGKEDIIPDDPADKLYNEGLYLMNNKKDYKAAAKRYVTLHPGSPDAAYAQFLIGSSYFDQIPDITRDQQRTEKAMQALDEVVR